MAAPLIQSLRKASPDKRFEHAVNLVLDEDESVSHAARLCGVSRPRLSERVKLAREKRAEQQARADLARAAANTREDHVPVLTNEARRVPPIEEFVDMYFDGLKCPRHSVHHETPPFHREIMAKITDPTVKRLLVNCPPGHELALDTPLLTADGWKTMGTVETGDLVVGSDGGWVPVVGLSPVKSDLPCYRVEFSDGEAIVASAGHHWTTGQLRKGYHGGEYRFETVTTEEIAATLRTPSGQLNHRIPVIPPVDGPDIDLPVDPYVFGYWLGDGSKSEPKLCVGAEDYEALRGQLALAGIRFSEYWNEAASAHYLYLNRTVGGLRDLGVLDNKHIPDLYFRASYKQRLALLQGLMDSDGTAGKGEGRCKFTEIHEGLTRQVASLAATLGYLPRVKREKDKKSGYVWCAYFRADPFVFRLGRKADRVPARPESRGKCSHRTITAVTPADSVPVRCITVASPDHLFAAGESLTLTHNSKSTCAAFTTVYEIVRNPNTQIGIMSATTRMAERFVHQIKGYLTDDIYYKHSSRNLLEEWGPFVDGRGNLGSAQEFYVAGRESVEKDPTVAAYGWGQQIQGTRMDRIICDDIAVRKNQGNPDRVSDMLDTITQDLLSRLDENGELVILGTRVFGGDVYGFLQELPAFEVIRYPCIMDEEAQATLWPDHFNWEAAERQRDSMSAELWDLTYQNSDMIGMGASFTQEQVERCLDEQRHIGQYPPGCALVLGIDPAGANAQSGYTAMILWAVDLNTGRRYLVDLVNHKEMKAPQVFQQIKDFATRYSLHEVRVETNGLAAQLFQYNTELNAFLGAKGVRLTSHITGRNKWDPQFGVEAMAPLYHNGAISIPWADYQARKKLQPFIDQLIRFPVGKPDDLVMAAWFGELGCKDLMSRNGMPMYDAKRHVPARVRKNRKVISFGEGVRAPTLEEERGFVGGHRPGDHTQARFTNVEQGHDGGQPQWRNGVLAY